MAEQPFEAFLYKVMIKTRTDRETGCWIWQGSVSGSGYPDMRLRGDHVYVHRLMHMIHNEFPDDDTPFVCHTCDRPRCVNPDHLWSGDNQDNMADAGEKGRLSQPRDDIKGEQHHDAKLTESEVVEIREKYAGGGYTQSELGDEYGVNQTHVGFIVRGEKWSHAGGPITTRQG